MKKIYFTISLAAAALFGAIPAAAVDYSQLEGLQGAALKQKVKELVQSHKTISYGDKTWDAFEVSDVRTIGGRQAWFDMYSNRLVFLDEGHPGMNIEHSVANSWWGGRSGSVAAYCDLHHLNPSDADANNRKNNNPMGVIQGAPTWTNGLTNIGTPAVGYGGGSTSVFEPADEYKGDFARAYFYIFTIYDDIPWQSEPACMYDLTAYPTLKPWAYEMLLQWAAADPVDEREAGRNAAVASIQENENPFIAIPGLAEYVWGSKKNTPFNLKDAQTAPVANRPAAPEYTGFSNVALAGVNTWTGRFWNAFSLTLSSENADADIYYTLTDSDEFQLYEGPIEIGKAAADGQTLTVKAYAQTTLNGRPYRGSLSTLTLTAYNPDSGVVDYQKAVWKKVDTASDLNENNLFVIVASKKSDVMSFTRSGKYITVAGSVTPEEGLIKLLPNDAAIVKFVKASGTEYYVSINDFKLENKGFLTTSEARSIAIAPQGAPVQLSLTPAGNAKIDFGSTLGSLQYNAQQPRFLNYTSSQQAVDLYKFLEEGTSTVSPTINLPAEGPTRIFTLEGLEVNAPEDALPAGLYIIVKPGKAPCKVLKH